MEQKEIEKLKKERDEFLAGWQRAKADLVNYKKEDKERLQGILQYAREELLSELFLVLDNLERAQKELQEEDKDSKVVRGFLQIGKQLKDFLQKQGVKEIEAEGKNFDPSLHEAVDMVEGAHPGKVAEVTEKGYMIQNRLLRAAKVKVNK